MNADFARSVLLPIAIFLIVFGIGLGLRVEDFAQVFRARRTLATGMILQTIVFPLVTLPVVAMLDLPPVLGAGFVLMAACPSGGFSNILTHIAGANVALSITMTTLSTLLAFVTMPAILFLSPMGEALTVPLSVLAAQLLFVVLVPISTGIAFNRRFPELVERYGRTFVRMANVYVYGLVALLFYNGGMAPFVGFAQAFQVSLGLFGMSALLAFGLAKVAGAAMDDAFTIAIEASVRNMSLATLIAMSTLARPELLASSAAYFFACALSGLVVSAAYKPYRARTACRTGSSDPSLVARASRARHRRTR